ncbi:transcription initiation factor IIF, beta subunit [Gilbertella persicaria]|uniref:transcription initiation factor IIF, beta subunit n=1 Tax=Gilbertella persicaria TaxID=101096 RepID=UPI002221295D|nr:transcription initiation factor IIF, beta subunit [Gilbertella persicaria]KAI8053680.1 transcription initiation factor IIF, beta subunit [Gilbertella persicaria]
MSNQSSFSIEDKLPTDDSDFDDEEDVNLDSVETKAWLVKVPQYLAQKWRRVTQDNIVLGKIRIYKNKFIKVTSGQNVPQAELIVEDDEYDQSSEVESHHYLSSDKCTSSNEEYASASNTDTSTKDQRVCDNKKDTFTNKVNNKYDASGQKTQVKEKKYTLLAKALETPNKLILSENMNGNKSLLGTVYNEFVAVPSSNQARSSTKKRYRESSIPKRTIQVLEHGQQPILLPGAKESNYNDTSAFITTKKQKLIEKRIRLPENELMDTLFSAFERYPYWSLKALIVETHQPRDYLKSVLDRIGILKTRGPYVGFYELKPEFQQKHSPKEPQKEASP